MSLTDRVTALSSAFLPLDQARRALLPPVRLVRSGAMVAARTVRHWELVLEGEEPSRETHRDHGVDGWSDVPGAGSTTTRSSVPTSHELPVTDWAELSYADAQARLAACDEQDLRTLLEYERTHGHRMQYTLLLEQRLAESA